MLHEVADVEARARLGVMLLQQVGAVQRAVVRIVHIGTVYLMILGVSMCDAVNPANDGQGEEDAIRNAPWPVDRYSVWSLKMILCAFMQYLVQAKCPTLVFD